MAASHLPGSLSLEGDAVSDETQLDGTRHLTIELADAEEDWLCTLHLILDAEGGQHEGELELDGPGDAVWTAALRDVDDWDPDEEGATLTAHFSSGDDGAAAAAAVALSEAARGRFRARLSAE
jgi:hypothetical protein